MTSDPDLKSAYALQTPDDNRALYARWADTYEADFAGANGYQLPQAITAGYIAVAGSSAAPVLDIGAGTGLVGQYLSAAGVATLDGLDISPQMLDQARTKQVYRALIEADLTQSLNIPDQTYAGAISAGTFTHGHVGPHALHEIVRVVRSGGWIVVSVNAAHWVSHGFDTVLEDLGAHLRDCQTSYIPIYDQTAIGDHAKDEAIMLRLCRS